MQTYKTLESDLRLSCGWCKKPVTIGQVYLESDGCVLDCDKIWHKRCVEIHDDSLNGEDPREAEMSGRGPIADKESDEEYSRLVRDGKIDGPVRGLKI